MCTAELGLRLPPGLSVLILEVCQCLRFLCDSFWCFVSTLCLSLFVTIPSRAVARHADSQNFHGSCSSPEENLRTAFFSKRKEKERLNRNKTIKQVRPQVAGLTENEHRSEQFTENTKARNALPNSYSRARTPLLTRAQCIRVQLHGKHLRAIPIFLTWDCCNFYYISRKAVSQKRGPSGSRAKFVR